MQYFGSKIVEGVAESWVEAEMSWVELGGAGWSWVEVDGGGWSWVEVGGWFSNTHKNFNSQHSTTDLIDLFGKRYKIHEND